jgi:hypothetical protein
MNIKRTSVLKRLTKRAMEIRKELDHVNRRLFEIQTGIKP